MKCYECQTPLDRISHAAAQCEQQLLLLTARPAYGDLTEDEEADYEAAENLVVTFLRDLGFEGVAIAFERMERRNA